jgi:hypothetical protein
MKQQKERLINEMIEKKLNLFKKSKVTYFNDINFKGMRGAELTQEEHSIINKRAYEYSLQFNQPRQESNSTFNNYKILRQNYQHEKEKLPIKLINHSAYENTMSINRTTIPGILQKSSFYKTIYEQPTPTHRVRPFELDSIDETFKIEEDEKMIKLPDFKRSRNKLNENDNTKPSLNSRSSFKYNPDSVNERTSVKQPTLSGYKRYYSTVYHGKPDIEKATMRSRFIVQGNIKNNLKKWNVTVNTSNYDSGLFEMPMLSLTLNESK